jgi:hypothetical protein
LHFGWTVDSIRRMTPEELFTAALGLSRQWRVAQCRFEGEPKRLELRLEHVPGEHFECPVCRASCGVHDTIERRWRHMNFFQYRCELVAKVPRTWYRTDGVHQVPVPWAREGSGFTLMMEALMMLLSAEMPVDAMADLLDEHELRKVFSCGITFGLSFLKVVDSNYDSEISKASITIASDQAGIGLLVLRLVLTAAKMIPRKRSIA